MTKNHIHHQMLKQCAIVTTKFFYAALYIPVALSVTILYGAMAYFCIILWCRGIFEAMLSGVGFYGTSFSALTLLQSNMKGN